jgi:hypothetical protein
MDGEGGRGPDEGWWCQVDELSAGVGAGVGVGGCRRAELAAPAAVPLPIFTAG